MNRVIKGQFYIEILEKRPSVFGRRYKHLKLLLFIISFPWLKKIWEPPYAFVISNSVL